MEVRELLSQAGLDTSACSSGSSTPKRQEPIVLVTTLPTKPEDFPKPVDTSSQVSAIDDAKMEDASLEEIPAPSSPTAEAPGPNSDTSHRCGSSLGRGQQGSRRPPNGQVFHQCPLVDVGLRVQHGPLWEWFWGYRVYQGGKGCLCPFYPGGWGLLFCRGDGCLESLPGYFHSAVTPQNCSASWRGIYWRWEKESAQLPLHLPGCLEGQPSRIPWHADSFLPHLAGTCTNGSFLWHSPGSSTPSTRACPRDFFPSQAGSFT